VIGYVRVSTEDQSTQAQKWAINSKVGAKGWDLVQWRQDIASGKSMNRRPMLQAAMADCRLHKADAIVVAKLDRLSRSVADFGFILEQARSEGWHLVMLDLELDTSTPMGEAMATMAMTFAQFERRMIGLRTKEALAQVPRGRHLNAKGETRQAPGRERRHGPAIEHQVRVLRGNGWSLRKIGRGLGLTHSTVQKVLAR